ncbi:acyl-CoA reductase [Lentimicrobium sp. L6]|nr:acyl-CoA reductase [Lentimicrobium sp. S6]NPD83488.1 acyl-CoA reductase [Lentimicrobium sp. L6]
MALETRIAAFSKVGAFLRLLLDNNMKPLKLEELKKWNDQVGTVIQLQDELLDYFEHAHHYNGWFTQEFVRMALQDWSEALRRDRMQRWLKPYPFKKDYEQKKVGVVMAGNLPLVGFHDYLSVLLSGHQLIAKLSSDDAHLLPLLNQILGVVDPELASQAYFTKGQLENFDAVIATGSNNTARYFEYYFSKYPHIIRKNRNGIAVLDGMETEQELFALSKDIMSYFGLGCRSVSKLYVPIGYELRSLFEAMESYKHFEHHNKYYNNYEYNKAIYLVNKVMHRDNGFLLVKKDLSLASPISVLHYEEYNSLSELKEYLELKKDEIQCIIGHQNEFFDFGQGQHPALNDYADGVDTMAFLVAL